MSKYFIGIDLGGTNIKLGCFDEDLKLVSRTSVPTNVDMGPEAVIENMSAAAMDMIKDAGITLNDVAEVGLGTPGPARYSEGVIIASTNMPKFKNVPIRDELSKKLGKKVVFENDANVACFGEHAAGAGKGVDDMIFFTLGTGIGGGILNGGKLLSGAGDNAAELGHLIVDIDGRQCNCGQKGCIEAYASASNTAKRAQEAVQAGEESSLKAVLDQNGEITAKDVYDHLAKGDSLAKRITEETAKMLAVLCVNVLQYTEPARIVFAGGMIAAGDILLDRIKYYFDRQIWKMQKETVEICFATVGEDAGIIGAAALAKVDYEGGQITTSA